METVETENDSTSGYDEYGYDGPVVHVYDVDEGWIVRRVENRLARVTNPAHEDELD